LILVFDYTIKSQTEILKNGIQWLVTLPTKNVFDSDYLLCWRLSTS
jgi:hypothetical protein